MTTWLIHDAINTLIETAAQKNEYSPKKSYTNARTGDVAFGKTIYVAGKIAAEKDHSSCLPMTFTNKPLFVLITS